MDDTAALHHYLEASALAFADRGEYVGDPAYTDVPLRDLLSDSFAAERACQLGPRQAATKPVAPGNVRRTTACGGGPAPRQAKQDTENINTTNLDGTDRWGNVVEYTLTIEQTGGSGMLCRAAGSCSTTSSPTSPRPTTTRTPTGSRAASGRAPRSRPRSCSGTASRYLALGSPGGSTIITTVLQMLFNRIDRGMSIEEAIAAPRASQRNTKDVTAEPAFIESHGPALRRYGHTFVTRGTPSPARRRSGRPRRSSSGPAVG